MSCLSLPLVATSGFKDFQFSKSLCLGKHQFKSVVSQAHGRGRGREDLLVEEAFLLVV